MQQSALYPTTSFVPAKRRSSNILGKLFAFGFILLFLIIGAFGLYSGWNSTQDGLATYNWPRVQGEILSAHIESHDVNSSAREALYVPRIIYSYQVNGTTFTSRTISLDSTQFDRRYEADDFLRKYREGAPVTVYYAPDNPSRALLVPGLYLGAFVGFGVGILFSLIGILLLGLVIGSMVLMRRSSAQAA